MVKGPVPGRRVRHRFSQGIANLTAPFRSVDRTYAEARFKDLPSCGTLIQLFERMPRAEQHHGIRVCRALKAAGFDNPDLLAAALLHDVGKIRAPLRLWERVLVVLVEHFAPRCAARYGKAVSATSPPQGLRRGFWVRRHHARWGAALAAEAGASARIVELIRQHHDPNDKTSGDAPAPTNTAYDAELAALQVADET